MSLRFGLHIGLGSRGGGGESPDNDMILVYEIPSAGTPIELAIQANSTWFSAGQEVVINWGDGSANETVSATSGQSGYISHEYTTAGTYMVKVSGTMKAYRRDTFDNLAGQGLLTHIRSFGNLGIKSFYYAFYYCKGLISVPKYCPKNISNMEAIFRNCSGAAFNPDVSNWDVSNVTNISRMFLSCSGASFNPDVSAWDVSNVENMTYMFFNCSGAAFNPNMKSWTLKTGVIITDMFTSSKTQPTTWLDELLVAWADNSEQGNNITIDFSPNKFTVDGGEPLPAVANALQTLEGKGWTITTANPYSST